MNVKGAFVIGSGLVLLAIVGFALFYLRQAAAEAEETRRREQPVADCAAQVQRASQLVTKKDPNSDLTRVTHTSSHYNMMLHQCYVEVTTDEHEQTPIVVKTLVSTGENSAVLWSVTGRAQGPSRQCFGADALPINCETADKRWNAYMTQ